MDVEHIQILSRAHQDEADCLRILVTLRRWEWSWALANARFFAWSAHRWSL